VGITIRVYYDAVIAVALMAVVAIICGFIAAVITGGSPPNFPVAAVAFLLTGAVLFLRLWRNSRPSAFPPDCPRRRCQLRPPLATVKRCSYGPALATRA
jgi:hypothetical protein